MVCSVRAAALLFIQLVLSAWAEAKRFADYKNPGSQGDGSFFGITDDLKGVANGYPGGKLFDPFGLSRGSDAQFEKYKARPAAHRFNSLILAPTACAATPFCACPSCMRGQSCGHCSRCVHAFICPAGLQVTWEVSEEWGVWGLVCAVERDPERAPGHGSLPGLRRAACRHRQGGAAARHCMHACI
jgi:hypothetical protein